MSNPGDEGTWSIGDPTNPTEDDAMCGSEVAAHSNAAALSRDNRVIGVWNGDDLEALYFDGTQWRKS